VAAAYDAPPVEPRRHCCWYAERSAVAVTPEALSELRERLAALRDDVLRQLAQADHVDAGFLALLGNVGAALAAVDAARTEAEATVPAAMVSGL
jgi:hypothetical protein